MPHKPEDTEQPTEVAAYWRYRKRANLAFLTLAIAGVVAYVLRRPEAWGDGKLANLMHGGSLVVAGLALVLAFRWNAKMAEWMGFCRGKYGKWPQDL